MKRNEAIFLFAVCIGTFIFEIANINGLGLCMYLPVSFSILAVALKMFPEQPKNVSEQDNPNNSLNNNA